MKLITANLVLSVLVTTATAELKSLRTGTIKERKIDSGDYERLEDETAGSLDLRQLIRFGKEYPDIRFLQETAISVCCGVDGLLAPASLTFQVTGGECEDSIQTSNLGNRFKCSGIFRESLRLTNALFQGDPPSGDCDLPEFFTIKPEINNIFGTNIKIRVCGQDLQIPIACDRPPLHLGDAFGVLTLAQLTPAESADSVH